MTESAIHDHSTLPVRVRPAVRTDLNAVLALEHASFTTDHLSRAQYARHIGSATARVLVAVDARGLLGSGVVFFRRDSRTAHLYSIAVDAHARGRKIGEHLLIALESAARARHCNSIRLEVRQDNRAATRLYERHGYIRICARDGYYEDGADAWRYAKALSSAL